MTKEKVIIIHGWEGNPTNWWFPWLKSELEKQNFEVIVPAMPETATPHINKWVPYLAQQIEEVNEDLYFVGHSIGCQTILRYLETLSAEKKIGGAVFVAGWIKELTNLEDDDQARAIAKEWLETPLDLNKVKLHLNKSVAIFSDNDPYVSPNEQKVFHDQLDSEIIVEPGKGHFTEELEVMELPVVRNAVLRLAGRESESENRN